MTTNRISDLPAKLRLQAESRGMDLLSEAADALESLTRSTPTAVERVFNTGDRVTKAKGSSWTGRVVGFYSTTLTPEGYAVESENEPGSVQIYPRAALTASIPDAAPECAVCGNPNRNHFDHAAPFGEDYHEFNTTAPGEVVQADRERAAELYLALEEPPYSPKDFAEAEAHRRGEYDAHASVQAFRACRIASSIAIASRSDIERAQECWDALPNSLKLELDGSAVRVRFAQAFRDHRLAFSQVGKVVAWLRTMADDVGETINRTSWAATFADEIEQEFLSTPDTVKGDRV